MLHYSVISSLIYTLNQSDKNNSKKKKIITLYLSRANVAVTLTVHLNLLIRRTAGLTGKRHTLSVAIPYLQITKPTLQ